MLCLLTICENTNRLTAGVTQRLTMKSSSIMPLMNEKSLKKQKENHHDKTI